MDYLASGLLLSLSVYKPTSLSTDLLITWSFSRSRPVLSVSIGVPLIDLRVEKNPLLRQFQAHLSLIVAKSLLTEISGRLCCVTAPFASTESRGWKYYEYSSRGVKRFSMSKWELLSSIKQLAEENAHFDFEFDRFWCLSVYLPFPKTKQTDLSMVCAKHLISHCQQNGLFASHYPHVNGERRKSSVHPGAYV